MAHLASRADTDDIPLPASWNRGLQMTAAGPVPVGTDAESCFGRVAHETALAAVAQRMSGGWR
jgi:hypothetical protein